MIEEFEVEDIFQKFEKTEKVQSRRKLKDRGPFYSFSTGVFSLYFCSFKTTIIKVCFVIFSFSRKMWKVYGLGNNPYVKYVKRKTSPFFKFKASNATFWEKHISYRLPVLKGSQAGTHVTKSRMFHSATHKNQNLKRLFSLATPLAERLMNPVYLQIWNLPSEALTSSNSTFRRNYHEALPCGYGGLSTIGSDPAICHISNRISSNGFVPFLKAKFYFLHFFWSAGVKEFLCITVNSLLEWVD